MKHKFRNTLLALAAFAMVGGAVATAQLAQNDVITARAVENIAYSLDGTQAGEGNGYNDDNSVTQNGVEWMVNGNVTMNPWRLGGKNISKKHRLVRSEAAVSTQNITKVVLSTGTASSIVVDSLHLYVGTSAGAKDISDMTATFAANSSITFDKPSAANWSGRFFTFDFELSVSGSSNKYIQFKGANFYYEASGSIQSVDVAGTTSVESGYAGLATTQLTATVTETGGLAKTVTWASGDETIAQVDNNGLVRFLKNGNTTITATSTVDSTKYGQATVSATNLATYDGLTDVGDFTDTATWGTETVAPFDDKLTNIEFKDGGSPSSKLTYYKDGQMRIYNNTILELECSAAYTIEYVVLSSETGNPFDGTVTASSGTAAVYGLDCYVFIGSAAATQNLTITYTGNNVYVDTMKVYYRSTGTCGITIDSPVNALVKGNTGTFTATASGATNPVITWSSSDSSVIEVGSTTGAYNAKFVGKATITATLTCDEGTDSASMDIVVTGPISIAEANTIAAGLNDGDQTDFKVTLTDTITDLNPGGKDEGSENDITLSDHKVGGTGESILVYGISKTTKLNGKAFREFGILNGTLSVTGYIKNYKGTHELVSPSITSYSDEAMTFASEAYEYLDNSCAVGVGAVTDEQWSHLSTAWASVDPYAQAKLKAADASYEYDVGIANWMNRYSIIVGAGRADFMDAGIAASWFVGTSSRNSNVAIVVTLFALFGAASVGACIYFKKRKRA